MYNVPAHDEDKKIFCDVFLKILPSNLRALLSNTHPTIFRQLLTDLVATHLGDGRARQVVVGELAERHQHQRHLVVRPVKVREEVETGLTRCRQRPTQYRSAHALNTCGDTTGSVRTCMLLAIFIFVVIMKIDHLGIHSQSKWQYIIF